MRVFWYGLMVASEEEESQKRGLVFVQVSVGSRSIPDVNSIINIAPLTSVLPIRCSAIHCCIDSLPVAQISATMYVLNWHNLARFRYHRGKRRSPYRSFQLLVHKKPYCLHFLFFSRKDLSWKLDIS